MAAPIDEGQTGTIQQAYTAHSGHSSVGPFIGVLLVIIVLGVIAGLVGRLCSGHRVFGRGEYDAESWLEKKCSSCIDGRLDPPPQLHPIAENIPVAKPVEKNYHESQQPNNPQSNIPVA